ncbi:hypothetical protein FQZ97_1035300 [compost metagenome]
MQGRDAVQLRLHREGLLRGEQNQVADSVGRRLGTDHVELTHLFGGGCHDELAAAAVRHAARLRIAVECVAPFHAQRRLQ